MTTECQESGNLTQLELKSPGSPHHLEDGSRDLLIVTTSSTTGLHAAISQDLHPSGWLASTIHKDSWPQCSRRSPVCMQNKNGPSNKLNLNSLQRKISSKAMMAVLRNNSRLSLRECSFMVYTSKVPSGLNKANVSKNRPEKICTSSSRFCTLLPSLPPHLKKETHEQEAKTTRQTLRNITTAQSIKYQSVMTSTLWPKSIWSPSHHNQPTLRRVQEKTQEWSQETIGHSRESHCSVARNERWTHVILLLE